MALSRRETRLTGRNGKVSFAKFTLPLSSVLRNRDIYIYIDFEKDRGGLVYIIRSNGISISTKSPSFLESYGFKAP